ncbi:MULTISPECIES: YjzD family protein [unclassified Lysinibacillus]|uniref:YjzD family protein n=1 Tax=unclassified Lysinibacillus TaxID=2636778 RepID=UPI0036E16EA4
MQYIMTFVWSFLLISMLNYVVSSVLNVPFDFMTGVIVSVAFAVIVFIVAAILPGSPEHAEHH